MLMNIRKQLKRFCSGHQRRNRDVSLFFMPSTVLVCHAVASRGSATAQLPVVGQADACGAESIDILQVVINE